MKIKDYIKRYPRRIYGFAGGCLFLFFIVWWQILPSPLFQLSYSTVLLDRNGEIIGMKAAADGQMRFGGTTILPCRYVTAVLMFEDRLFMCHKGVNWWAIGRALIKNIRAGKVVSGGSTLSMQVVRMARGNPDRTIYEKFKEMFLTIRLEQSYSKKEILEMYASHAPFGGNVVGIRAAALKYFHRSPEQLSWAEAALLAVLPNAPALVYPGKNNSLLKQKRDRLLKKLYQAGVIDTDDYRLAILEPLPQKTYEIPSVAPHVLNRACTKMEGKVCHSFIDTRLQNQVNDIVNRHIAQLSYNYVYNAAVLVAHIPTGEVRAYVGNAAPRKGSQGNDVDIIRSRRSSGSILKPALYALMQQGGFILSGTLIPDIPSRFGNYAPSNFSRDFRGAVPASQALAQSLNIPFVRMLRDYSYARFYDDLKQLGITTLDRGADHYGLSMILGGAETTLWEICNMYGGMAAVLNHYAEDDGKYFSGEYERLKMWQQEGEEKEQEKEQGKEKVLKASAIWLTLKALEEVERPEMESGWKNFVSTMNLSWKTGTSFGFRDAWAVGVNPEYVIGVWVGNANGEGRPGLVGVRAAAPILFEVAALLPVHRHFYPPAEEMKEVVVCRRSGYLASALCDETDTIKVCENGARSRICPYHRLVHLDPTGQWRVHTDCEKINEMQVKPWFVLPPVQEWYYCRTHVDYQKLPPYRKDCRPEGEEMMEMVYPQRGTRVFIPRYFEGKSGKVIFEAVHRSAHAKVYWHIDEQYRGMTHRIHQMEIHVKEGNHLLTLVDEDGNMLKQRFKVVGKDHSSVNDDSY